MRPRRVDGFVTVFEAFNDIGSNVSCILERSEGRVWAGLEIGRKDSSILTGRSDRECCNA